MDSLIVLISRLFYRNRSEAVRLFVCLCIWWYCMTEPPDPGGTVRVGDNRNRCSIEWHTPIAIISALELGVTDAKCERVESTAGCLLSFPVVSVLFDKTTIIFPFSEPAKQQRQTHNRIVANPLVRCSTPMSMPGYWLVAVFLIF